MGGTEILLVFHLVKKKDYENEEAEGNSRELNNRRLLSK